MKGRKEEGITLIALVITIIVLLILAGVTISLTFGENGILARAKEGKDKYAGAEQNEIDILDNLDNYMSTVLVSEEGYNEEAKVNEPKLAAGMIPVYYDETAGTWKVAPKDNTENKWYSYTSEAKQWANIVTVSDENASLRTAAVGTEIPMEKITTFFVWIPRYAYSINAGYYKTSDEETPTQTNEKKKEGTERIDITFIKGNTNVGIDGTVYPRDYDEKQVAKGQATPKIVHPAFTFGDEELTGIWVAKFEASGTTKDNKAVGNKEGGATEPTVPDESTYVKIIPNVVSWRHISVGESQYQSMSMKDNKEAYGWNSIVDSHLIKNSEWGAVAYLCYSQYGTVPMINGNGSGTNNAWYDFHTGAGPKGIEDEGQYNTWNETTNGYSSILGQLASTTGNVYGIYDMNGGSWELVAAFYDAGDEVLSTYGNSENIKYFDAETNTLNPTYTKYWEAYEVSGEEKNNKIKIEGVEATLTREELWNADANTDAHEKKRYELTKEIWNKLAKKKGTGINEVAESWSYIGLLNDAMGWKVNTTDLVETLGQTWNNDQTSVGYSAFVVRGGMMCHGAKSGVLKFGRGNSGASERSFHVVLAF